MIQELLAFNCPNCGAHIEQAGNNKILKCNYCGTSSQLILPRQFDYNKYFSNNEEGINKLENNILILKNALKGENYEEAYRYSNKCLELNPNIGELWEYKAICVFWLCMKTNDMSFILDKVKEVKALLNASKELDPNSTSYNQSATAIGYNLSQYAISRYSKLKKDEPRIENNKKVYNFSKESFNTMKLVFEIIEKAYDLMGYKNTSGLKFLMNEYANRGKLIWWEPKSKLFSPKSFNDFKTYNNYGIDVRLKWNELLDKIRKVEPDYNPPSILYKKDYNIQILIGIILITIIIIVLAG